MTMFKSARIRLTAWYGLIIMMISLFFSVVIYQTLTNELIRIERAQQFRIERRLSEPRIPPNGRLPYLDPEVIQETKQRIILTLVILNGLILGASAAAGYFLAGRTLKPIKLMVEEQNRFISDASHELRTPLTSLKAEIEVNLRSKALSAVQAKKVLKSNLEEVNNLQSLSDDLIKLTMYRKAGISLNKEPVYLGKIITEAINKVAKMAALKKITIKNESQEIIVNGNQSALVELLVILLDNAIKYSQKQTIIRVISEKSDGHVLIKVADRGIGIEADDLPYLFDRFYRADKSRTKNKITGYGLGLSIAKQIAEEHKGTINVTSVPEKGSTFTIELPA